MLGHIAFLRRESALPKPKKAELNIVRLTAELAASVDAWAAAHAVDRSDAIPRLLELGLNAQVIVRPPGHPRDDLAIEAEAASRIGLLIDPETPEEERERRIHRLTEGPPEFVGFRIDLPGRRDH
ncbi:MAG: hypothetical protein GY844_05790 [Bradyrhizobium sp.]|nr:hypothetical protein [Bradyrhizobium sp.]